jgi:hypothetical protein
LPETLRTIYWPSSSFLSISSDDDEANPSAGSCSHIQDGCNHENNESRTIVWDVEMYCGGIYHGDSRFMRISRMNVGQEFIIIGRSEGILSSTGDETPAETSKDLNRRFLKSRTGLCILQDEMPDPFCGLASVDEQDQATIFKSHCFPSYCTDYKHLLV